MAQDNYYPLYVEKVLQLAQTIVIKSEISALQQNKFVRDYFGSLAVDDGDPTTWKYYLNLAGLYHPHDTQMTVVSLDTLETIVFSKENLVIHRATARGYVFGTRQHEELVSRYPHQETLIKGILYPVDLNTAITAKDGTILTYPANLVEANEYSLVAKLQGWVDRFYVRWVNSQFTISDDLYAATYLASLYTNMVAAILTFRKEACKTNEAHSFHVRQYLASHGFLDAFVDQMTLDQALFFYRNITYIERNAGKRDTFAWLVEHIMTQRNLPLAEFTMRHNTQNQPEDLYPELLFRRNPLNLGYSIAASHTLTLDEMFVKEVPLARDNAKYQEDYAPGIKEKMENSLSNVELTKALESSAINYDTAGPHTLEDILISHWLYLSFLDKYLAYIVVTNPHNGERVPLTVKEAFIFAWYAQCKLINIDLITIPPIIAKYVQRLESPPNAQALLSVVDTSLIPLSLAQQALSIQPSVTTIVSTEAFYNFAVDVKKAIKMQRNLVASVEHNTKRGMASAMVRSIYCHRVCQLAPAGTTYASWFNERSLKIADLTNAELSLMYNDVVQQATGLALKQTTTLHDLQSAMVKLLLQLSSYSIQVISDVNDSTIENSDWTAIRVGDQVNDASAHALFPGIGLDIQNRDSSASARKDVNFNAPTATDIVYTVHTQRLDHPLGVLYTPRTEAHGYPEQSILLGVRFRHATELPTNTENVLPVFGLDTFLALNQQQRQQARDVYSAGNDLEPPPGQIVLGDIITDRNLDGS